jgi:1D-myo-inositol-triphosphate 3-kinase
MSITSCKDPSRLPLASEDGGYSSGGGVEKLPAGGYPIKKPSSSKPPQLDMPEEGSAAAETVCAASEAPSLDGTGIGMAGGSSSSNTNGRQRLNLTQIQVQDARIHSCGKTIRVEGQDIGDQKQPKLHARAAGHSGSMHLGGDPHGSSVFKRTDIKEAEAYDSLRGDPLGAFVPTYGGVVNDPEHDGTTIMLDNLLRQFCRPHIMDCKLGTRTFLEEECTNPKLREDLYKKLEKLRGVDATEEERRRGAITKLRYMTAREQLSSSHTLGFRIDGIVVPDAHDRDDPVSPRRRCARPDSWEKVQELETLRERGDVLSAIRNFVRGAVPDAKTRKRVCDAILARLSDVLLACAGSPFFATHELVGTSLLFCCDPNGESGVWLIDLAKALPLQKGMQLTHARPWEFGNHEDGWLSGLQSLQAIWAELSASNCRDESKTSGTSEDNECGD